MTKTQARRKQVDLLVERRQKIDDSIDKTRSNVWGQCTSSLQSVAVGLKKHEEKKFTCDVAWSLESLKLATSEIDSKSNKHDDLVEAILTTFAMRQGDNESNDGCAKRFKDNSQTLELVGGERIFRSTQLDGNAMTEDEKRQQLSDSNPFCF